MANVILYQYGEMSSHPKTKELYNPWDHIWLCLEQLRKWNPSTSIYMITGNHNISQIENFQKFNVNHILTDDLEKDYDIDKTQYGHTSQESRSWLERNFYIESLIKKLSLTDIFSFDNDVLVYEDLEILAQKCSNTYTGVALTRESEMNVIFGMCYIKNYVALKAVNKDFWHLINTPQGKDLMDMELWNILSRIRGKEFVDFLPTWTDSSSFKQFNGIFDPISIGQYLSGTHWGLRPGVLQSHHFIHQKLSEGRWFFSNEIDENGRKFYSVNEKDSNNKFKIFSIHVHSKKLFDLM